MKILIAFYSRTGNTAEAAEEIKERLEEKGHTVRKERIMDQRNRKGFWGSLRAAWDSFTKNVTLIEKLKNDPADYDLIVIGTPVWAWNMTPAVRTYIIGNKEYLPQAALFATHEGSKGKVFSRLENELGQKAKATIEFSSKISKKEKNKMIKEFLDKLEEV